MPNIQLQFRRGTAAQWSAANPTLASGEMGLETDTDQFKIGDGTTAWNSLSYGGIQGPAGATGATGATGAAGPAGQGVPTGGTTGQLLSKVSATDYDTTWTTYTETDPVFSSHAAHNITSGDIANLANLSGVNTGDQNLSGLVPYTGATTGVNLGSQNLQTTGHIAVGTTPTTTPVELRADDNAYIAPTGPVVFQDSFIEASNTLLNLHTPNVGTSWSLALSTGGATYTVNTAGTLQPTSTLANVGCLYLANNASPSAAVEVGITVPTVVTATNTVGLVFRYVDANNFYLLTISSTAANTILWKKVAGVWSNLGASINNISASNTVKVRAVGSNIVVYVADIPVITRVDTSITAAGLCGISAGTIGQNATDDVSNTWRLDNFYVQNYASSGGNNTTGINVTGDVAATGQIVGHNINSRLYPAFTFAGDTDTGIFRSGSDNVAVVTGSGVRLTVNSAGIAIVGQILASNTGATAPAISFGGDSNTGFYSYTGDTIGIATGATLKWLINGTGILSTPSASISGTPDIATYNTVSNSGGGSAGFQVFNTNDYVNTYFRAQDYSFGGGIYSEGKLIFHSGIDYTLGNSPGVEFQISATNYDSVIGDFNVTFGAVTGASGGNIYLTAGASNYSGLGGNITLSAGSSADTQGGAVSIIGGTGPSAGSVTVEGGYGQAAFGGTLYLLGGSSVNTNYGGTVYIRGGSDGSGNYGPLAMQPVSTGVISVFGAAGSLQYTTAGSAATFVAGTGTTINSNSTFDGYTVAQVVKALRDFGWLA